MADNVNAKSSGQTVQRSAGGGGDARTGAGKGRQVAMASLRSMALATAIAVYVVIGAFIFRAIEGQAATRIISSSDELEPQPKQNIQLDNNGFTKGMERVLLERIWQITAEMNVLYEKKWYNETQLLMADFTRNLREHERTGQLTRNQVTPHDWTLPMAAFYSFATAATIGCCPVKPQTALGMAITVMYAIIGTPLVFYFLISTGRHLADGLRHLVRSCRCFCRKADVPDGGVAGAWPGVRVLLPVAVLLLFGVHVLVGGVLLLAPDGAATLDVAAAMFVAFSVVFTSGLPDGQAHWAEFWPRDAVACVALIAYVLIGMLLVSLAGHLIFERPKRCCCSDRSLCASQNTQL